jgi:hypothetical protein
MGHEVEVKAVEWDIQSSKNMEGGRRGRDRQRAKLRRARVPKVGDKHGEPSKSTRMAV